MTKKSSLGRLLERTSKKATVWAGSSWAFSLAVLVIVTWLVTGPLFHYSDTWQLVINTSTTIVTFLMVFLIQRAQNKDGLAIQLKLNEIVAALDCTSNRLIDIEDLEEDELDILREHYRALAKRAKDEANIVESHSLDEAEHRHRRKERVQERAPKGKGKPDAKDHH